MRSLPLSSAPRFVGLACGLALLAALVAQYGLGLRPCELCLLQRVPFLLAGVLAGLALVMINRRTAFFLLMGGAIVALLVNSGIAVYHVGVEQQWWISSCSAEGSSEVVSFSAADLAAALSRPVEVSCSAPAWSWHGVTMAGLNVLYSAAVALGGGGLLYLTNARRS